MEIVVNDTNIFIDLHSIRLLDQFFELPITGHTVDFVEPYHCVQTDLNPTYLAIHPYYSHFPMFGVHKTKPYLNHSNICQ